MPVDILDTLRREVILTDLIARNFENIDIRPVFEDLDRRLTAAIGTAGPTDRQQTLAFEQREALRRVAIGATARQVASLLALEAHSRAEVTYHQVTYSSCADAKPKVEMSPAFPEAVMKHSGGIIVNEEVKDGTVLLSFVPPEGRVSGRPIDVSFYDMPVLENLAIGDGERVAFSLNSSASRDYCTRFKDSLDAQTRANCIDFERADHCAIANVRVVILPRNFLGLHDRPYQNDLAAGRYREPWWKLW